MNQQDKTKEQPTIDKAELAKKLADKQKAVKEQTIVTK